MGSFNVRQGWLKLKKISIYIDEEIEKVIENLGPNTNKGQFLREAIKFYINHHKSLERIEKKLSELESGSVKAKENQEEDRHDSIMKIIDMGE